MKHGAFLRIRKGVGSPDGYDTKIYIDEVIAKCNRMGCMTTITYTLSCDNIVFSNGIVYTTSDHSEAYIASNYEDYGFDVAVFYQHVRRAMLGETKPNPRQYTPENITELASNEVFVFGSNKAGNHAGGAAKAAIKWGAVMGVSEGLQGQTYAIPTLDENMEKVSTLALRQSITRFLQTAMLSPETSFLFTKIGCGIAGFTVEEMRNILSIFYFPRNVVLPIEFYP